MRDDTNRAGVSFEEVVRPLAIGGDSPGSSSKQCPRAFESVAPILSPLRDGERFYVSMAGQLLNPGGEYPNQGEHFFEQFHAFAMVVTSRATGSLTSSGRIRRTSLSAAGACSSASSRRKKSMLCSSWPCWAIVPTAYWALRGGISNYEVFAAGLEHAFQAPRDNEKFAHSGRMLAQFFQSPRPKDRPRQNRTWTGRATLAWNDLPRASLKLNPHPPASSSSPSTPAVIGPRNHE